MQNKTVEQLRSAVRCGAWTQAESLLDVLQREVESSWQDASDEDQRLAIRQEVFDVLEWTRQMTLAGRAHSRNHLIRVSRQGAYLNT
jgi:hypothetical protein